jgi:hypothetical protein
MAGDHVAVMIDEGRDREAKGLDRAGELPDLLRAALAGVARIELQLVDPAKGDLERRGRGCISSPGVGCGCGLGI